MIPAIKELNFPEYATLSQATVTLNDMGERVITAQVSIDGSIRPNFSYNWEVEFMGERYTHPLRTPQAIKDNSSICSKIDLVFEHWAIYNMKRFYFVELASTNAGTAFANKYIVPLGLNLGDFCTALQNVLDFYFKDENFNIKVDLNPELTYSLDRAFINISYSYIWDVLQQIHKIYGVRWYFHYDDYSGIYYIKIGYPTLEVSHIFEYGYDKGLISLERQVQDTNIRNSLLGRGGSQNLPKYYFKNAPEGSLYASDPDAIPELEFVAFTELRGKTFRDYVKGWKAANYGGVPMEFPTEAYNKGFTDAEFDPVEDVKDNISIAKYGFLQGGLDNNEEIYPSIQNISLDGIGLVNEVVAVEQVLSDDVEQAGNDSAIISNYDSIVKGCKLTPSKINCSFFEHRRDFITIEDGYVGTLLYDVILKVSKWNAKTNQYDGYAIEGEDYSIVDKKIKIEHVVDRLNGVYKEYDQTINLPSGKYVLTYDVEVKNLHGHSSVNPEDVLWVDFSITNIKLTQTRFTDASEEWKPTFDIWIKNIWQTEKLEGETDQEYADRVWLPILGTDGQEAMVTFSSGWLAQSEDWEFKIVKGGYAYDTTQSYNGVPSHWKLTLEKTDAELESIGLYIPNANTNGNAVAGDTFFFTGIDMPHQYVLWGEQRVDEWKTTALDEVKDIKPTWVARLDKIRIHTLENGDSDLLVNELKVGSKIRIADKRFIDAENIELYLQSITYTYTDKIIPDVEIVLSDKMQAAENPVQQIQGEIELLSALVAHPSASLVRQIRQIFDAIYLRKDGVEDLSKSPTSFTSLVKSGDFRAGMIGGKGWGIYRDGNGNTIAEFDQLKARQTFTANDVVRNEVKHEGGRIIYSAASMLISKVEETDDGYKCYFDQEQGSKANLFALDDVALCQLFSPENVTIRFYKRRVIEVAEDYVTLSKTDVNGTDIPQENDTIIHFGNYTNELRQYVIIRDVIGGGTDEMLMGLNTVNSLGNTYYFAGMGGGIPQWFVGDRQGDYAEWDGESMRIKGKLEIGSDVGGATVVDGGLVTTETISLGSEGAIKAGVTGGGESDDDVRFWAGVPYEQRALAPFRVNQSGQVVMTSGVFGGYLQTSLIDVQRLETTTPTYGTKAVRLTSLFNIFVIDTASYEIILPNDLEYVGRRVTIVNGHMPPYTRIQGPVHTYIYAETVDVVLGGVSATSRGYIRGWNLQENVEDWEHWKDPDCIMFFGGIIELLCILAGEWVITNFNALDKQIVHTNG